jgi:hypothetical protein
MRHGYAMLFEIDEAIGGLRNSTSGPWCLSEEALGLDVNAPNSTNKVVSTPMVHLLDGMPQFAHELRVNCFAEFAKMWIARLPELLLEGGHVYWNHKILPLEPKCILVDTANTMQLMLIHQPTPQ